MKSTRRRPQRPPRPRRRDIAVVGMAGRFPGAANVEALWRNLLAGSESIVPVGTAELARSGLPAELLSSPAYVPVAARVDGFELFDASFFGLTPREAEGTDPQHRLLLECAWEALENAGYDPSTWRGRIGLYAGAAMNRYFLHLESSANAPMGVTTLVGFDKDFLTTRISYRLGLEGPSVAVQTACSTSLVAVHLACQSLLAGECDLALAGGVAVRNLYGEGYLFEPGGILSPDGHCRAFDAAAAGTVPGDGLGLVALKRLDDALADGDAIAAVIKGSAINNDGAAKIGYTAPGLAGQVRVLRDALAAAGIDPATVSYVEAHGTGTPLGDPIEAAALAEAYGGAGKVPTDAGAGNGAATPTLTLGSIKTNLGHLDCAAGVAGLIKAVLALRHGAIPPSLHFTRLNPQLPAAAARFTVNSTVLRPWAGVDGQPRRAAVSSFGIGGTNAHVILEEAPPPAPTRAPTRGGGWQLLQLSARTEAALARVATHLVGHLESHPALGADGLADMAFTLRAGRRAFEHRHVVVCRDAAGARSALAGGGGWTMRGRAAGQSGVAFLLPGQGAQQVGMAASLYRSRPAFRAELDRLADRLAPHLDIDLRDLLYPRRATEKAARRLARTRYAQPAIFAIEYALARLWIGWGIRPASLLGHSLGELVAACLAGVFRLEEALALVALRGRLIDELPPGAMLAVPLAAAELAPLLGPELALAAENAADRSIASGPAAAIDDLERRLAARGVAGRRLRTSHAFHSPTLAPAVAPLVEALRGLALRPPTIPFVSNLTGAWIKPEEATDPAYWGRQMLQPVRFAAGLRTLAASRPGVLLEVGPGEALGRLVRRELRAPALPILSTLAEATDAPIAKTAPNATVVLHADAEEHLLRTAGRLWLAGAPLDPYAFTAHERRRRVALPTYPFERQRYWLPRPTEETDEKAAAAPSPPTVAADAGRQEQGSQDEPSVAAGRRLDPADWFYLPSWRRSLAPFGAGGELPAGGFLLYGERPADSGGALTAAVAARLRGAGRSVTLVVPGPAFARLAEDSYALRPADAEDQETLWAALAATGIDHGTVLHLWSATETTETTGTTGASGSLDAALERGFYSLMALGRALGRRPSRQPLGLWVVSRGVHDVAGGEAVSPERATLLGPCRVLPLELPHVTCRSLDLPPPAHGEAAGEDAAAADEEAERLLAEVAARPQERILAYRGPHRWTQDFAPVRLGAGAPLPLRPGGVYLITGGLGGVGQAVAHWLARAGCRLVLLGRSPLPSRERRWRELEDAGAEVMLVTADVTDGAALTRVRAQIFARFGALHGVVHAAGVAGGGIVQLRRRAEAAAVLAPKVQGTLALCAVFPPAELDFLVLCSSVTASLGAVGQADYCAANAFLDAFAAAAAAHTFHRRQPRPGEPAGRVVSIAWDRWDEVGMAAEAGSAFEPVEASSTRLPPLAGEAMAHPMLDRRLPMQEGRQTFVTRFSAERHWMLDEHRFGGTPVMPGTALLELARAAAVAAVREDGLPGGAGIEIRSSSFVAPLVVPAGESCDVVTTLTPAGDGWQLRIASRVPGAGWREHAVGEVAPLGAEMPPPGPMPAALGELLAAMPLSPLASGLLPAPPTFSASASSQADGLIDLGLTFGPRWQDVRIATGAVGSGGDELLARCELPGRYAAELETMALHPALLDLATGFVHAAAGEAEPFLPFSYTGLRLWRPLPAVVYSHARRLPDAGTATGASTASTRRYALTLYDAAGEVLLVLDEYAFRRVEPSGFRAASAASAAPVASVASAAPVASVASAAPVASRPSERAGPSEPTPTAGLSTAEGIDAFGRILAQPTLHQVLVSTHDLRARAAAASADTGARLLAELADLVAPVTVAPAERYPRPALAAVYAAPRDAAEERLAEIWQELLGIEQIGIDDDFFELGGDSVLGLRIAALARQRGIVLAPNELFTHPTIAALARHVASAAAAAPPLAAAAPAPTPTPAAHAAGAPPAEASLVLDPEQFPDAEVSSRDLATLLAQLDAAGS